MGLEWRNGIPRMELADGWLDQYRPIFHSSQKEKKGKYRRESTGNRKHNLSNNMFLQAIHNMSPHSSSLHDVDEYLLSRFAAVRK